jgi:glycine dehydrogenase
MGQVIPNRNYNKETLPREKSKYYMLASDQDIEDMLTQSDEQSLVGLFDHIPSEVKMAQTLNLPAALEYDELEKHLWELSLKNKQVNSFIGDGLHCYAPSPIIGDICSIRGLTTAYTPYQPERSQGTLQSLWIYQSIFSKLTGFEAINASLYERSTGIFEAIKCADRLTRDNAKVLVIDSIYPGDKEVLLTLTENTDLKLNFFALDESSGQVDIKKLRAELQNYNVLVYSQVTHFGTLENVDAIADLCHETATFSICSIDPMLINNNGLKPPTEFGEHGGPQIIIGEAQNYALDKNFGGPGLGLFGVRFNDQDQKTIRSTPGRYVGLTKDINGNPCKAIILSTREQHIRRDKATSNICSNQSFVATLAGANALYWGSEGLGEKILVSRKNALKVTQQLLELEGIELAFSAPFFNEVTFEVSCDVKSLQETAILNNLEIGVDISSRVKSSKNLLKIFFSDEHTEAQLENLINFFKKNFVVKKASSKKELTIPASYLRKQLIDIKAYSKEEVIRYYKNLGSTNFSPDDGVYPLGSCTMKYNPYLHDHCAGFAGFVTTHPQSDEQNVQGNLELLFHIQEIFKAITGLPGVTTQPVAGAQGELVGLKLFQAYHKSLGQERSIVLIPRSAHGTNPATAVVAGLKVITLNSDENGQVCLKDLKEKIEIHSDQISSIMITNPNTSGIFESNFKYISKMIHDCGGLVYMDGANMNAIAGQVDLNELGVDAVHNNLHKTWTIPHGGGGPGDGMVAVSEKLIDFLPGKQIRKTESGVYESFIPSKSIGSFHRHWGNFAHKIRCYTYIRALGSDGVKKMSAVAVLSARYIYSILRKEFPILPSATENIKRMHEFIITLSPETFKNIEAAGLVKSSIIGRVGKSFLDFGFHAPTVAFPEVYGLMIEPTESFSKKELDDFISAVLKVKNFIHQSPEELHNVPRTTETKRVDEVLANKNIILSEQNLVLN